MELTSEFSFGNIQFYFTLISGTTGTPQVAAPLLVIGLDARTLSISLHGAA